VVSKSSHIAEEVVVGKTGSGPRRNRPRHRTPPAGGSGTCPFLHRYPQTLTRSARHGRAALTGPVYLACPTKLTPRIANNECHSESPLDAAWVSGVQCSAHFISR
jgi:hypothetical protein